MRDLLDAAGRPLAAPSANASGRISPTRAEHVLASLGGRIPLIVDGGPTAHGLEIDDRRADRTAAPRLLRPGPIDLGLARSRPIGARSKRPASSPAIMRRPSRSASTRPSAGAGRMADRLRRRSRAMRRLSASGDLVEAAASLFDRLHEAEAAAAPRIAVAPIPDDGPRRRDQRPPAPRRGAAGRRMMPLALQAGLWGLLSGSALLIGAVAGWFAPLLAPAGRRDHGVRRGRADLGFVVRADGRSLAARQRCRQRFRAGRRRLPRRRRHLHRLQCRARPVGRPPPQALDRRASRA